MLSDDLQNLRGTVMSRAAQYTNPLAGLTVHALPDQDGQQANTAMEKEKIVRHQSVPMNDNKQYSKLPPA
jgi:hypothetical protein